MINLDSLGLGPTEVWVSQSDPLLVSRLIAIARLLKLPVTGMNFNGVGESDEESFIREKVSAARLLPRGYGYGRGPSRAQLSGQTPVGPFRLRP
jgi:hypothetical protein